jgi:hypothetical protein
LLFDPEEISDADLLPKKPAPDRQRLNEVLRLIAQLGGFLGRRATAKAA